LIKLSLLLTKLLQFELNGVVVQVDSDIKFSTSEAWE